MARTKRKKGPVPVHPVVRFLQKIKKEENGCWRWTGCTSNGYGMFRAETKMVLAHRFAYWLYIAEPPVGMDLDHLCRNRWCCNPDHLEPVTRAENLRRGYPFREGGYDPERCPQGHERSEANTYRTREGKPFCRPCAIASAKRYQAAKKAAEGVA